MLTSEIIVLTTLLSFLSNHLMFPIMTHMLDQLMVESLKPCEYEYLHHGYSTRDTRFFQSLQVIKALSRASTGVPLVLGHEQAHDLTKRQIDNEQSQHSFIYYLCRFFIMMCITECQLWYVVNFHHE